MALQRIITLTLSNPLEEIDAEKLGLDVRRYRQGEKINLSNDHGRGLIVAGYTTIDPEDKKAVLEALRTPPEVLSYVADDGVLEANEGEPVVPAADAPVQSVDDNTRAVISESPAGEPLSATPSGNATGKGSRVQR